MSRTAQAHIAGDREQPILNEIEVISSAPEFMPTRSNDTDAGADLRAAHNFSLRPGEYRIVGTGVQMNIPAGYFGLICGRSGLAGKRGIDVLGGVVDAGYQGEIRVVVHSSNREGLTFKAGERIAQIVILPVVTPQFVAVNSFEQTSVRGDAGFGSTGK